MSDSDQQPTAYQAPMAPPEKKPRGCLFWGCLIVAIALGLLLVLAVAGGVGGYYFLKGQINAYTEETPAELPVVELSEEQVAEIQSRIEGLQDAVENDGETTELVLTADEINALIASNEEFKGKVFVRIEDGQIAGDVSIPTDFLPIGKGRYFNASASFEVSLENGVLVVKLKDATVKGQPLPKEVIDAIAAENLAKDLSQNPELAEKIKRFESIEVRDNKLILRPRKADLQSEAPAIDLPDLE